MFTGVPTAEPESRRATRSTATIAVLAVGWIEASAHRPPAGTLNDSGVLAEWGCRALGGDRSRREVDGRELNRARGRLLDQQVLGRRTGPRRPLRPPAARGCR